MNKTFTINLANQIFNINEDAYEILLAYFSSLEKFYANEEGKDDIITDIKARFAELFFAKGKNYIVTKEDAENIIQTMGKPNEFDAEINDEKTQEKTAVNTNPIIGKSKRLYRDTDNKLVAGVCAGLSAYFGIKDSIWMRLLFIVMVFIGFGSPFLIYIILWIVMPEAITAAQKLEMKGEPINLENIQKIIKDESSSFQTAFKEKGAVSQIVAFLGACVKLFFKILLGLGVAVLGLVGIALIIAFFAVLISLGIALVFSMPLASKFFFDSNSYSWFISIGGILVAVIPFILVITGLVHVLSKTSKPFKKQIVLPLFGLFMFGLLLLNISYRNGKSLIQEHKKITQHVPINYRSKLDTIDLAMAYSDKNSDMNLNFNSLHSFLVFVSKDHELNIPVEIEIYPSNADSVTILKEFSAQGSNEKEALINATSISHTIQQQNNKFIIDPFIVYNTAKSKFRNQKLTIKIFVPEGKVIRWNKKVEDYLDVDNLPINWNSTKTATTTTSGTTTTTTTSSTDAVKELELKIKSLTDSTNVKININSNNPTVKEALEEAKAALEDAKNNLQESKDDLDSENEDTQTSFYSRKHYIFKMHNGELIPLD